MLRWIRVSATLTVIALAGTVAIWAVTTREESVLATLYEAIFGPPDLGHTDFETLSRPARPNSALACPASICLGAKADFDPGVFPVSDEELRVRFERVILGQPLTQLVYRQARPGLPLQDRYIQRSRLMQFPDTIDIRFIALTDSTSTVAIYSRSQIGYSDMGVNLARIRAWVDAVQNTAGSSVIN